MVGIGTLRAAFAPLALAMVLLGRSAAADPNARVLPFAEDEKEAPRPKAPAASKSAPMPQGKASFQPRFRSPGTRRTAHDEPSESASKPESTSEEASGPKLEAAQDEPAARTPTAKVPATAKGDGNPKSLIDEAFAKSKTASTDADYTEIIELCRKARGAGIKKVYEDYCNRLLAWAHNRRGEARAETKRDSDAMADFEAAVALDPQAWRPVHNRGVSFAAQGKIKEAMNDFNRTLELHDRYPNAYFNRAQLRYTERDFHGAIDDYTAALELGKPDAAVLSNRGHAFFRLERFGEALRDYAEALRVDPNNLSALINRGEVYCDLGRYGEAAADYQAAIKADPKSGRAYQSAAWLMATCPDEHYRNKKLAIDASQRALEHDGPNTYRALETLAAAQANAGKFAEAKATQEKAIAKAARTELVAAEKRMGLYQRDLAYRERARLDYSKPEDEDEKHAVHRAAAYEKAQSQAEAQGRRVPPPRGATRPRRMPEGPPPYDRRH